MVCVLPGWELVLARDLRFINPLIREDLPTLLFPANATSGCIFSGSLLVIPQTINYYNINDEIYFVDLPGYGYAQANEHVKAQWGKMIEDYLHKSKQLKLVFLLIDIRHAPSENDRIMYDWIRRNGYDPIIIATKLDKINRSQIQKQVKLIRTTLQAGADTQIIPYSAQTKQGREEIYEILDGVLAAEAPAQE